MTMRSAQNGPHGFFGQLTLFSAGTMVLLIFALSYIWQRTLEASALLGRPNRRAIGRGGRPQDAQKPSPLRSETGLDVAVIGEGAPGEAQTMTARRVSGAQPLALFCAAGAGPARTEAGMTSSV
jgi:hypothetical protein